MEPWHYEPAADLDASFAKRLERFPREPDMSVYAIRSLFALLIRSWLKIYHGLRVRGLEHLPQSRSYVIVANHASHLDAPAIVSSFPFRKLHRIFPAAARDYFFVSVPRTIFSAIVVNALPFDRKVHIRHSLEICRRLLESEGNILLLFPEGTRTETGEIRPFKPGVGLLLAGLDVPAVPCHIRGGFEGLPKGRLFPRPSPLKVRFGSPLRFPNVAGDREGAEKVCREIQTAVQRLGEGD